MTRRKRILLIALLGLVLPPISFYSGFELAARYIVAGHELPRESVNGVKHAYTAAVLYNALRQMSVSQGNAENLVEFLGVVNERIEEYIKIWKKDSSAEIRKDLYNNWVGISAAEWRLEQDDTKELAWIIVMLAKYNVVLFSSADLQRKSGESSGISAAQQWLSSQQPSITANVYSTLNHAH